MADRIMQSSALITRLRNGDPEAEHAFFIAFGNFVQRFPGILDRRVREGVSRQVMRRNEFGKNKVLPHLIDIIRSVRTMRAEESEHAGLWWKAAKKLGIDMSQDNLNALNTPEMQELTSYADTTDVRQALAAAKATEEIAGSLSRLLLKSPKFVKRQGGEFEWGEVHVSPEFLKKTLGRSHTEARGVHDHSMLEHDDVDKLLLVAHGDSPKELKEAREMIQMGMIKFANAALSVERMISGPNTPSTSHH